MHNRSGRRGVALYGVLPPPFGGVSVHVQRISAQLRAAGLPFRVYDRRSGPPESRPHRVTTPPSWRGYLQFLLTVPEPLVHLHTNRTAALVTGIPLLAARGRRVLVTLHSEKPLRDYQQSNRLARLAMRRSLCRAAHLVAVSEPIGQWLRELGVPAERISTLPAFVPPTEAESHASQLPLAARRFLTQHAFVVGSHGWFGYFHRGVHVYSFDLLGPLLERIRQQRPKAGLFTVVSGTYDPEHRREILRRRRAAGLEPHWLIIEDPVSAVALYRKADVFVRPTTSDGDSVSIRECLHLGVPVVASDAVTRPAGCRLFPSRDARAMAEAVLAAAGKSPSPPESPQPAEQLIDLYRELLRDCGVPLPGAAPPQRSGAQRAA